MTGFFEKRKSDVLLAIFSRLQFGHLVVTFPDGARHEFTGVKAGPRAEMTIMDMAAISRILSDGKMGFCEAVMDGQIDSPSMSDLIELAVLHDSMLSKQMSANAWRKIGLRLFHGLRKNSKSGAARNISYHYDLGNDFYAAWLDRTMTYSSAVYQSDSDDLAVRKPTSTVVLPTLPTSGLATMSWKLDAGGAVLPNTRLKKEAPGSPASPSRASSMISRSIGLLKPGWRIAAR